MSTYNRRLAKLEPKPEHNQRLEEACRRIRHEMFRWREWLLSDGPPTRYHQERIDTVSPHCGGFEQEEASP